MSPSSPKYSPTSPVSPSSPKYCKQFLFCMFIIPTPLKLQLLRRIPQPVSRSPFSFVHIYSPPLNCNAAPAYCKCIDVLSESQKVTFSSPRVACIQPDVTPMVAIKSCSKRYESPWAFIQHLALLGVSVLTKIHILACVMRLPLHSFRLHMHVFKVAGDTAVVAYLALRLFGPALHVDYTSLLNKLDSSITNVPLQIW